MKVHVFSYSPRQGTAAADFAETVPPPVKAERRERLRLLERELAGAYLRSLVGRRLDVLVEGAEDGRPGFVRGTACRYVPVVFRGYAPALIRRVVPVRATAVAGDALVGEPEEDAARITDEPAAAGRNTTGPTGRRPLPLFA